MARQRIDTILDLRELVRAERSQKGLSGAEVARRAGVSRQWIQKLETGTGTVQLESLMDLLAALDLHLVIEKHPTREIDLDDHLALP